ncbi:hypothetical protein NECAME_17231 [Necator americanus]|uniref:Uncharacterized protein n=1 Tax=Necator americanus TaxID=51031 RepID=W2TQR6_NECAM|nr:hypothetical protein NECAME_17231 [Necator americanus]ETN84133.1 hypothetical protein NECAME_17231 [Necator americanus]
MFTLTNGPSALMHLIRTAYNLKQQDSYDLTMICRIAIGDYSNKYSKPSANRKEAKLSFEEEQQCWNTVQIKKP